MLPFGLFFFNYYILKCLVVTLIMHLTPQIFHFYLIAISFKISITKKYSELFIHRNELKTRSWDPAYHNHNGSQRVLVVENSRPTLIAVFVEQTAALPPFIWSNKSAEIIRQFTIGSFLKMPFDPIRYPTLMICAIFCAHVIGYRLFFNFVLHKNHFPDMEWLFGSNNLGVYEKQR